jgi:integrase
MALTVKKVEKLIGAGTPGRFTDGAKDGGVRGLMLVIESKTSAAWLLRWQRDGRVRHMGLGSARDLSLAAAREKARRERERLANGVDPLDLKRQDREAQREADAKRLSFRQAAERCHEAAAPGWSDPRTGDEFLGSLQRWVYPHIGSLDVAAIDKDAILKVLEQRLPDRMGRGEGGGTFWVKRSQTADRTRQRIERVLDWAEARGFRPSGTPNPARWKNFLDQLLAAPRKIRPVANFAAVPFAEIPITMATLAADRNVAAQCLRFIILTAARLSEALKATWDEIDFEAAEWCVPKERMKGRREHRVPLSPQAIELLRSLYIETNNPFLFVGSRPGTHIAASAVGDALRRAGRKETIHGMRSTFSTWAAEKTGFPNIIVELSLAHRVGTAVVRAYQRSDLTDKRRELMAVWAKYCCTPQTVTGEVVSPKKEAWA